MILYKAVVFAIVLALNSGGRAVQVERDTPKFRNAVYFTNWGIYGRDYHPINLPASQINQALYAFANIRTDGSVYASDTWSDVEKHYINDSWNDVGTNVYGCLKQLYRLKMANRHLKVLLSVGGWTYSGKFVAASSTAANRSNFAKTAVALMKDWGFDGIDIDWEYPSNESEADNLVSLLQALREELDLYSATYATGCHFFLTAAVPAGPSNYEKLKLSKMVLLLDQFNLMAYDYAGSWDATSGHQANLYFSSSNPTATKFSTDSAITAYLEAGVPADKIVLGIPTYGWSFESTDGIGEAYSGIGQGSWEAGVWDYKALPRSGANEQYDPTAGATYSYDPSTRELVSYDNVDMIERKVAYLQKLGLGGSVFWEAAGDRNDNGSLIAASFNAQRGAAAFDITDNCVSYPNSRYDNIRGNFS
ncbi:glycoside hydrolase family 18 protein [Xylariaceae sp. FL0594]|nr:glycoside hydrolase family 18 protein [Xylariaceae sp. FL0594]